MGQAAFDPVDEQGRRATVGGRQRECLPDRAGPEDHHVLSRLDPAACDGADCDRDRLDESGERRVLVSDGEDPRGGKHELLL